MKLNIKAGIQQGDSISQQYVYTIPSCQDVANNSQNSVGPISGQDVDQTLKLLPGLFSLSAKGCLKWPFGDPPRAGEV